MIESSERMILNLYYEEKTYFMIWGLRKFAVKITQSHIMPEEGFKEHA